MVKALNTYRKNGLQTAEILWTLFALIKVLKASNSASLEETRDQAQHELLEYSVKLGRRLEEGDIERYLPAWAM